MEAERRTRGGCIICLKEFRRVSGAKIMKGNRIAQVRRKMDETAATLVVTFVPYLSVVTYFGSVRMVDFIPFCCLDLVSPHLAAV